ncbi:hypothetical protein [Angelakisella massiliensis]|uniref:hypothetical protein n=1 Tax=Angelakisella massiliensis TaxID=1871018 RepID=UPI0008F8CF59|nr:hypothetical protein [Angelakisella massiliensis]
MKYLYTNVQLGDLLAVNGKIIWETNGFSVTQVRKRTTQGYVRDGSFVSLLPAADEGTLSAALSEKTLEEGEFARIIDEAEAAPIREEILAVRKEEEEAAALTPTDEDLYRASVLKLLTELKMNQQGGASNV